MQGFVLNDFSNPRKQNLRSHLLIPQIVFQPLALIAIIVLWPGGETEELLEGIWFILTALFIGLLVSGLTLTIEDIGSRKYRLAVMAEAAGDHTKAIAIIRKRGLPHLLSTYRQRYQNDLSNQNQITQPNVASQTQNPSVINIHNVQTQQGPTEINVQDSVVTEWKQ